MWYSESWVRRAEIGNTVHLPCRVLKQEETEPTEEWICFSVTSVTSCSKTSPLRQAVDRECCLITVLWFKTGGNGKKGVGFFSVVSVTFCSTDEAVEQGAPVPLSDALDKGRSRVGRSKNPLKPRAN